MPPVPGNTELARRAREAVMARQPGIDQQGLAADPPPALNDHITALRTSPAGAAMLAAGWRIAVADLSRVCAFQPAVFADTAADRVADAEADDLAALARITLPVTTPEPPQVGFDAARQAFTVLSPDPNLRIIGQYRSPLPDARGALSLGFLVQVTPSYLQVIQFQDRYLLHDGYHRAYGLLTRGITTVPVFIRTMNTLEDFAVTGMLPYSAFLGSRPPLLPDYHDDQVACSVRLPVPQKMIVIQGLELNPTAIGD